MVQGSEWLQDVGEWTPGYETAGQSQGDPTELWSPRPKAESGGCLHLGHLVLGTLDTLTVAHRGTCLSPPQGGDPQGSSQASRRTWEKQPQGATGSLEDLLVASRGQQTHL